MHTICLMKGMCCMQNRQLQVIIIQHVSSSIGDHIGYKPTHILNVNYNVISCVTIINNMLYSLKILCSDWSKTILFFRSYM